MLTPIKWIKNFVPDLNVTPQEFADKLTLFGSKVETYNSLNKRFSNVIIGKIVEINKHPDADKLVVCNVDIGSEVTQIVTAAKNVFEGAKVPVVLPGGFVAGDGNETINIKKGKLRGIESFGMFCSIHELGFNTDMFPEAADDGIYICGDDAVVGQDIDSYLGLDDCVFEYEITSNRVDCFSIYGLAREAAAAFNLDLVPYKTKDYTNTSTEINNYISVEVKNTNLCKRYCAKIVKDIHVSESPKWLKQRLMSVGIRPINNIVDITNYVMEEIGQPMHAYDLNRISGNKIIVDNANTSTFITLDSNTRNLDSSILMINDSEKPIGIAGIMGGESTKMTDSTNIMLFEAACFDGTNIRLSSKKIGLRTDASTKFEKGLDPNNAIVAINRACELIEELNCGTVVDGIIDIHNDLPKEKELDFDIKRCNKILGTTIDDTKIKKYFSNLGLRFNDDLTKIYVPTFRQDIELFADLVEEVARSYGYDNIPVTIPQNSNIGKNSELIHNQDKISSILNSMNYNEIMTYSFEGKYVFDKLLLNDNDYRRNSIEIRNPLGEAYSIMRTIPYNGMLSSLRNNFLARNSRNVKKESVCLFEFANTYIPTGNQLPDEKMKICMGNYYNGDFFKIKQEIETLLFNLGLKDKIRYNQDVLENYFHPGRQAKIYYNNILIGEFGEVHPDVSEAYEINQRVYLASIDYDSIKSLINNKNKYIKVSKYPSITRDLCLILSKDKSVIEIENIFDKYGTKILQNYSLFDIYEGENLPTNTKSVAYNLIFNSSERTLSDDEINKIVSKILSNLEKIGIELRK